MLKDNTVYNHPENEVLVKTNGDLIYIICSKESQQDIVIQKKTYMAQAFSAIICRFFSVSLYLSTIV